MKSQCAALACSVLMHAFSVGAKECTSVPVAQPTVAVEAADAPEPMDVIFFTDGCNFDDTVSLHLMLKSPKVNLKAIYTQGNGWANPAATFRNFYNIMQLYGVEDVPIWAGSYYALQDVSVAVDADRSAEAADDRYRAPVPAGPTGLLYTESMWGTAGFLPQSKNMYSPLSSSDTDEKSIEQLLMLMDTLDSVTIFSSGTFTPFAKILAMNETVNNAIWPKVDEVWTMAGAVDVPGNLFSLPMNTAAEFNMYNDPRAAQLALTGLARYSVPVTLVPLDATNDVSISQGLFDALGQSPATPEAQHVGYLMTRLQKTWFAPDLFFETSFLWDTSAAVAMLDNSVIKKSTTINLKVIATEGIYGAEQGATRRCTAAEAADATLCAPVNVVFDLDGGAVDQAVIDILQSPDMSAAYELNLFGICE